MDRDELLSKLEAHASEHGLVLNPDESFLNYLLSALLRNLESKGELYCPCRVEYSSSTICPCEAHLSDIESSGHCHCHLFFSES